MYRKFCKFVSLSGLLMLGVQPAFAAHPLGLEPQPITLQSAGLLSFGPSGVLFIGDPKAATLYAIDSKEASGNSAASMASDWAAASIHDLRTSLAMAAGSGASIDVVKVSDLAVDLESGTAIALP